MAGRMVAGSRRPGAMPGKRMLVVGIILALASPLAGLGLGAAGLVKAAQETSAAERYRADDPQTVELEGGSLYTIWQISPTDPGTATMTLTCSLTGPDGSEVAVKRTDESVTASTRSSDSGPSEYWRASGSFTPGQSGKHTLNCTGAERTVQLVLTPSLPNSVMAMVIGGLTLGVLGFLTGIGLIVAHFIRRRRGG